MAQRMLLSLSLYTVAFIELNSILNAYGKDCLIRRAKRDKITLSVNRTSCMPSHNPCSEFGSILELTNIGCTCICPSREPTYMDTTNRCAAYKDVWSECNLSFRRQLSAIPIFSSVYSTSLRLNIPKKFKGCKMKADERNSFYLSGKGWSKPQKLTKEFPFLIKTNVVKKRLRLTYLKWKTQVPTELVGKVFRLGITCGKQMDCVTFKISGKTFDQCMLPPTTVLPVTLSSSSPILLSSTDRIVPHYSTLHAPLTRKNNITTEQHNPSRPSPSKKRSRELSSMMISWSIIGITIGVIVVLLLCIGIMAACFWRRRKNFLQKNQNSNASTQSSRGTSNCSEIQPEVTYAPPHHPYQQLKPPISGTPRGTYQSLQWNRKDSSGYTLPSESSATNNLDPLYNEIGSPKRTLPLVYDYALPEDTVRFNKHLSGIDWKMNNVEQYNTGNGLDYVGRTSMDQEEPQSPSLTVVSASMPPNVNPASPEYLDFNSEESSECRGPDTKEPIGATRLSKYKKPGNTPKSPFKKSSVQEHAYQVLESPGAPDYQKILLENLDHNRSKNSTA